MIHEGAEKGRAQQGLRAGGAYSDRQKPERSICPSRLSHPAGAGPKEPRLQGSREGAVVRRGNCRQLLTSPRAGIIPMSQMWKVRVREGNELAYGTRLLMIKRNEIKSDEKHQDKSQGELQLKSGSICPTGIRVSSVIHKSQGQRIV